jgi:hypothetical protein
MSRLWIALAACDGLYPYDTGGRGLFVPAHDERRFDRVAGKYPIGLSPVKEGDYQPSGVVWSVLKGNKAVNKARGFYKPPTVLYSKGARGIALWSVRLGNSMVDLWDANVALNKFFGGRVKDADPRDFRLTLSEYSQAEWTENLYDLNEVVGCL